MPAARPRMHVTPSETVYRLLQAISKATGTPPATLVRELLDEAVPALETTLEAIRLVKNRPAEAQAAMARLSAMAINQLTQAQLDLDTALKKKRGRKPGRGAAKTG